MKVSKHFYKNSLLIRKIIISKRKEKMNILVTGTPGTGKTTLCENLKEELGMTYVSIGKLIKDKHFYLKRDEVFDTFLIDEYCENNLLDYLESIMAKGNILVDFHSNDFFPERFFNLVVVLRTDNSILYDRLTERGYSEIKIKENVECEIFQIVLEEARESYSKNIILELKNNTIEDMENNIEIIKKAYLSALK